MGRNAKQYRHISTEYANTATPLTFSCPGNYGQYLRQLAITLKYPGVSDMIIEVLSRSLGCPETLEEEPEELYDIAKQVKAKSHAYINPSFGVQENTSKPKKKKETIQIIQRPIKAVKKFKPVNRDLNGVAEVCAFSDDRPYRLDDQGMIYFHSLPEVGTGEVFQRKDLSDFFEWWESSKSDKTGFDPEEQVSPKLAQLYVEYCEGPTDDEGMTKEDREAKLEQLKEAYKPYILSRQGAKDSFGFKPFPKDFSYRLHVETDSTRLFIISYPEKGWLNLIVSTDELGTKSVFQHKWQLSDFYFEGITYKQQYEGLPFHNRDELQAAGIDYKLVQKLFKEVLDEMEIRVEAYMLKNNIKPCKLKRCQNEGQNICFLQ